LVKIGQIVKTFQPCSGTMSNGYLDLFNVADVF